MGRIYYDRPVVPKALALPRSVGMAHVLNNPLGMSRKKMSAASPAESSKENTEAKPAPSSAPPAKKGRRRKDPTKNYLQKTASLIPAEIVAVYVTVTGMIPGIGNPIARDLTLTGTFILCAILTPLYLLRMRDANKPYKMHVLLSSFAFFFWAYRISGDMAFGGQYYNSTLASILLVLFTAVCGVMPLRK